LNRGAALAYLLPPILPALLALSGSFLKFPPEALPPLLAISLCFSGSIAANPLLDVLLSAIFFTPPLVSFDIENITPVSIEVGKITVEKL
jgi:hypothetical protein